MTQILSLAVQGQPRGVSFPHALTSRPTAARAVIPLQPCETATMANDKQYQAEYLGSGTFLISKPKRKKHKLRQSRLKSPQRGARK